MSQQNPQDFSKHKPYFDTLISYTQCTGYTFIGTKNSLVCAEFRFAGGGKFPLALNPQEGIAHNVDVLQRAIGLMQFMDSIPQLRPLG